MERGVGEVFEIIFCAQKGTENLMIILLTFAFLSGLVTILAPCIWPILPIILSGSIAGRGHQRPLGITLGVVISFAFFTLAISSLVRLFHLDPNVLRNAAVIVISVLGISMIFPQFATLTEVLISRISALWGRQAITGNDFLSGLLTGFSLGILWSPCAGPILASIATLSALGQISFSAIAVTLSYVLGVGIPLFVFSFVGQTLFTRTHFLSTHLGKIQQVFGVVMLLTALAIFTHYDTYLQVQLLNAFPQLNSSLTAFESNPQIKKQLDILKGNMPTTTESDNSGLFNQNLPAPDFVGITKWLNTTKPLTITSLKGKVVLVDFWTYTCINCIRTLPHVTSWYEKYKNDGFVVIGVHTPEFQFEHDTQNVRNAMNMYKINYPVAQDNNYATWNNYSNEYWPAEYLIDATGNIRRTHFGEGEYDTMEKAIQTLLKENGKKVATPLDAIPDTTPLSRISPETYLGAERMEFYYPTGSTGIIKKTFADQTPTLNSFSLGGKWDIQNENAVAGKNSILTYHFYAGKVFLVLRPPQNQTGVVKVMLDGKNVDDKNAGNDVKNSLVTVDTDRLYNLIDLKGKIGEHTLRLEFLAPGISAFAFTFGEQ